MYGTPAEADGEEDDEESWAARFAALVTGTYAQLQNRAADKCGVAPGEAWRTALEAAASAGVRQVCTASHRFLPALDSIWEVMRMLHIAWVAIRTRKHMPPAALYFN